MLIVQALYEAIAPHTPRLPHRDPGFVVNFTAGGPERVKPSYFFFSAAGGSSPGAERIR